jgi:hypothetical protein
MDNSHDKMELIEAVVALRLQVESQLRKNEYYVALKKLDEVMAVIRPAESSEGGETPRHSDSNIDNFSMARLLRGQTQAHG